MCPPPPMRRLPPARPEPPRRKPLNSCLPRRRSSPPTNRTSSQPKLSRPSRSRPRNPAADSSVCAEHVVPAPQLHQSGLTDSADRFDRGHTQPVGVLVGAGSEPVLLDIDRGLGIGRVDPPAIGLRGLA